MRLLRVNMGGTGLGLAISKQLIDLMRGSINVQNTLHKRTTFVIFARFDCKRASDDN